MPPKKKPNDQQKKAGQKEREKKREQSLKDKTFGLKNKNKSKVVQQHINNMQKSVSSNPQSNRSLKAQQEKKKAKEAAEAAKREMELLFKTVKKKETVQQVRKVEQVEEKPKVVVDPKVRIQQLMEGKLPELKDRSLEDRVEEARKLVEKKVKMTAEVFQGWLDKKNKQKREKLEKERQARIKANKLTGRELWNKGVKVQDDEAAVDAYDKSSNPPSDDEEEDEDLASKVEAVTVSS